jgi:two-component system, response regulator RpfG
VPSVIVIDDQSVSRVILSELVRSISDDITAEAFADPVTALTWIGTHPVDLVLTDFKMPHMDGVEFTRRMRQVPACLDVPLVMITCVMSRTVRYRALEAGATDFLTKPIDHVECRARCQNLLKLRQQQVVIRDRAQVLEDEVREATRAVELREKETLFRLARAGEYRDEDTGNHVLRVARFARLIADSLRLDPVFAEVLEQAAPMHDIGKIGIPDHILLKPGRLNGDEWEIMKTHSRIGYEILHDSPSKYLRMGATIAHAHHECFDGSGYPLCLAGEEIPIEARITAVADVFDALRARRPYKAPWSTDQAFDYLQSERGRQFDPNCVDAFLDNRGQVAEIAQSLADVPVTAVWPANPNPAVSSNPISEHLYHGRSRA